MLDLYNDVDSSTKLDFFVVYTFIVVINITIYRYDNRINISKNWSFRIAFNNYASSSDNFICKYKRSHAYKH